MGWVGGAGYPTVRHAVEVTGCVEDGVSFWVDGGLTAPYAATRPVARFRRVVVGRHHGDVPYCGELAGFVVVVDGDGVADERAASVVRVGQETDTLFDGGGADVNDVA